MGSCARPHTALTGSQISMSGSQDSFAPQARILADFRLAPEVAHVRPWYSWLGGAGGAALGYIVANVPGAVAGGEFPSMSPATKRCACARCSADPRLCGQPAWRNSRCKGQERGSGVYRLGVESEGRGEFAVPNFRLFMACISAMRGLTLHL